MYGRPVSEETAREFAEIKRGRAQDDILWAGIAQRIEGVARAQEARTEAIVSAGESSDSPAVIALCKLQLLESMSLFLGDLKVVEPDLRGFYERSAERHRRLHMLVVSRHIGHADEGAEPFFAIRLGRLINFIAPDDPVSLEFRSNTLTFGADGEPEIPKF